MTPWPDWWIWKRSRGSAKRTKPRAPVLRGSAQNGTYSSRRAKQQSYYNALPAVVEEYMEKVNAELGTNYKLFNYYGAPDAEYVMWLWLSLRHDRRDDRLPCRKREKVGLLKVRLYRPFVVERFIEALPKSTR